MPSALETLVKILRLEQDTGYQNKAVIGGLQTFAARWAGDAHAQAKKPEHHTLVDELVGLLENYVVLETSDERHTAVKHMLGRIMGRIPPHVAPNQAAPEPARTVEPSPEPPSAPVRLIEEPPDAAYPAEPDMPPAVRIPEGPPPDLRPARPSRPPKPARPRPQPQAVDSEPEDERPETPDFSTLQDDFTPAEPAPILTPVVTKPTTTRPPVRRGPRDPQREVEARRALQAPVNTITGVGPKVAEKLAALGLRTVEDWLYYFPRRYDDFSQMLPLNKLKPGMSITVAGMVRNVATVKGRTGTELLNVTISDSSGTLTASFFGQPYLRSKFERGIQVVFSGKTDSFQGRITMTNPEWEMLDQEALHTRGIVPVYSLTRGLTTHAMRKLTYNLLERRADDIPDHLPDPVLTRVNLCDLGWAIRQIHFPESQEALKQAQRRLAFDEILMLQLGVLRNRRDWQAVPGFGIQVEDSWLAEVTAALPYSLTGAQRRAIESIRLDMAQGIPMNRLLQGDVGAGKTVVAAICMAIAAANGCQAAIMAPTSILAEQHYKSLNRFLKMIPGGDKIKLSLLTGATPAYERNHILERLDDGRIQWVVGTHALIQENVNFQRLALAVIDEQHRFGVEQRGRLRGKGQNPHILVMTATPIPRTLALTVYADLDLTVLDEMPPGRTPVDTKVLFPKERERAFSFIEAQVEKGRQAFIIYPLVEASESDTMAEVRSAVEEFERLQRDIFPKRKLGLLHGRLSANQKDSVMAAFGRGELDILVSTSVVEVGIDVPNASVILIEGANRFGLAQLHQFRGRVGRGEHHSYCLLLPDDGNADNPRLRAMESTTDGFALAEMDWELRGAGDLLGTRQSGGSVQLADHVHPKLVSEAQIEARTIYEEDPALRLPEHSGLRAVLDAKFGADNSADVS